MRKKMTGCRLFAALIMVGMASALCLSKDHETKIIIGALLSLHGGDNCTQVDLGAMQEMAALENTIKTIYKNKGESPPFDLELKFFDTCSNEEGAVKGVLKALVASKQTCSTPPLFAGFIGPNEPDQLAAAHQVSAVFNITHSVPVMPAIPAMVSPPQWTNSIFAVSQSAAKHRVQAIMKVLRHLNWNTIVIITDDSSESIKETNMLRTQSNLCIKTVYKMNNNGLHNNIIAETSLPGKLSGIDGVVLVMERANRFNRVIRYLEANIGTLLHTRFLLYVAHVGVASWQLPPNAILMQEVSEMDTADILPSLNSTQYAKFVQQQLTQFLADYCQPEMTSRPDCSLTVLRHDLMFDLVDSSVTPLTYSLQLLVSALKTAHRIKCKAPGVCPALLEIPAQEWKSYLTQTSVLSEHFDLPRRIKLNMDLPVLVNIYVKDGNTDKLLQVGAIQDDGELNIMRENILVNLKKSISSSGSQWGKGSVPCDGKFNSADLAETSNNGVVSAPAVTPAAPEVPRVSDSSSSSLDVEKNKVDIDFWGLFPQLKRDGDVDEFYQTALTMSLVGFGMLLFLLICIYIIYSSFRISSGKSDSSDGSGSGPRPASRSPRRRQSSFRSSFRRQPSSRSIRSTRSMGSNASA